MRAKRALLLFALPVLLGLGCYAGPARVSYAVAYGDPPPAPAYYYTSAARDGYVWVDGSWYWNDVAWAWRPGYWVGARPGFVYVQGYWAGRAWHPGVWRTGTTVIRDHRAVGTAYVGAHPVAPVRGAAVRAAPPPAPVRTAPPPRPAEVRDHRH